MFVVICKFTGEGPLTGQQSWQRQAVIIKQSRNPLKASGGSEESPKEVKESGMGNEERMKEENEPLDILPNSQQQQEMAGRQCKQSNEQADDEETNRGRVKRCPPYGQMPSKCRPTQISTTEVSDKARPAKGPKRLVKNP